MDIELIEVPEQEVPLVQERVQELGRSFLLVGIINPVTLMHNETEGARPFRLVWGTTASRRLNRWDGPRSPFQIIGFGQVTS